MTERAAGGIVLHPDGTVLMIRDRYGRWTFPKGHVEAGETDAAAALREIEEETGVTADILSLLGTVRYTLGGGRDKTVVFYVLAFRSGEVRPQAEEITACAWVEPEDARRRLVSQSYEGYVELLERALRSKINGRGDRI